MVPESSDFLLWLIADDRSCSLSCFVEVFLIVTISFAAFFSIDAFAPTSFAISFSIEAISSSFLMSKTVIWSFISAFA